MYSSTVYVHFYVVSALFVFHATLAVRIPTVFRHCVRTFLLLSSTFCMHFYVLHSMRAFHSSFLKEMESWRAGEWNCLTLNILKRNGELESWRAVELYSYCIPLGSPKVMYSSTVYVHLYFVSALFVFHSTLVVRIPTVFRHSARALLVLSSTRCMHFYVFHSMRAFYLSFLKEMESWRAGELESWRGGEL